MGARQKLPMPNLRKERWSTSRLLLLGASVRTQKEIKTAAKKRRLNRNSTVTARHHAVKWRWGNTFLFSFGILVQLLILVDRRHEIPTLFSHFPLHGFTSTHFLGGNILCVLLFVFLLCRTWYYVFEERAARRRLQEQRKHGRSLTGENVWPPAPGVPESSNE